MVRQATLPNKVPRNAPCPCGSGRKYKHCCGHVSRRGPDWILSQFAVLPPNTRIYYLDTCVWSSLSRSDTGKADFVAYFQPTTRVAVLSLYTLFELSRASLLLDDLDCLFYVASDTIHIASFPDPLIESEVHFYRRGWRMRWLPLRLLVEEVSQIP